MGIIKEFIDKFTGETFRDVQTPFFDSQGRLITDPRPVAAPLNLKRQPSIFDQVREMQRVAREEMSRAAEDKGFETFEESDDFEVGEDFHEVPPSLYENEFDPSIQVLMKEGLQELDRKAKLQKEAEEKAAKSARTPQRPRRRPDPEMDPPEDLEE